MRVAWNAGASLVVLGSMTMFATFGTASSDPARASAALPAISEPVADMPVRHDLSDMPHRHDLSGAPHRHYSGLAEHFAAANSAHDGKLTMSQAMQNGWTRVIRHFDEIDASHAGFVTEAQIHAYNQAHRHARKPGKEI